MLLVLICLLPAGGQARDLGLERFLPLAWQDGLPGIQASRVLPHLHWQVGLLSDIARDVAVEKTAQGRWRYPVAWRLRAELGATLGIADRLDVTLVLPAWLWQESGADTGIPDGPGLSEVRLGARVTLLRNEACRGFGLAIAADATFPTARRDRLMGERWPTVAPRLVADWRDPAGWLAAVNAGYRLRKDASFGAHPSVDEVLLGAGVAAPLGETGLAALLELDVAIPAVQDPSPDDVAMELRGALRWRHRSGVTVMLGAGGGLTDAFGVPSLRGFLGIAMGPAPAAVRPGEPGTPAGTAEAGRSAGEAPPARVPLPVLSRAEVLAAVMADPDADRDGLPADQDGCPDQPEDRDGFQDEDGCPDPDNDGDGVPDASDRCPGQPEVINGVDDQDGCPDEGKALVAVSGGAIQVDEKIYFQAGSDVLKPESGGLLRQVAALLKSRPDVKHLRVDGHTDAAGDREKNVDLSERRARCVVRFLVNEGVQPSRLSAKGFGSTVPLDPADTAEARTRNRRVEFTILPDAGGEVAP